MDNSVKIILKKLDDIDARLKTLESQNITNSINQDSINKTAGRDTLFSKALEIIDKVDEISAKELADALKIDVKRAETIMDQLEEAGIGVCYMKEV